MSLELAGAVLIGTACGLALVVGIAYFVLKQAACNIKRIKSLFRSRLVYFYTLKHVYLAGILYDTIGGITKNRTKI